MTNWQPIETAPRDGTEILALEYHTSEHPELRGFVIKAYATVRWMPDLGWRDCGERGAAGLDPFEPQYWMPLPEPPGE